MDIRHHAALEPVTPMATKEQKLWDAANALEASFLAEMLKSAGLGEVSAEFGGGIGEEQYASFLRDAQAKEMVRAGGVGLAESFFNALKESESD